MAWFDQTAAAGERRADQALQDEASVAKVRATELCPHEILRDIWRNSRPGSGLGVYLHGRCFLVSVFGTRCVRHRLPAEPKRRGGEPRIAKECCKIRRCHVHRSRGPTVGCGVRWLQKTLQMARKATISLRTFNDHGLASSRGTCRLRGRGG